MSEEDASSGIDAATMLSHRRETGHFPVKKLLNIGGPGSGSFVAAYQPFGLRLRTPLGCWSAATVLA
jgi:hypothetical protein